MTFKKYIVENLNKINSKKEKVKYLDKIISDSYKGISFEFQINATGMGEEALYQLDKLYNL